MPNALFIHNLIQLSIIQLQGSYFAEQAILMTAYDFSLMNNVWFELFANLQGGWGYWLFNTYQLWRQNCCYCYVYRAFFSSNPAQYRDWRKLWCHLKWLKWEFTLRTQFQICIEMSKHQMGKRLVVEATVRCVQLIQKVIPWI